MDLWKSGKAQFSAWLTAPRYRSGSPFGLGLRALRRRLRAGRLLGRQDQVQGVAFLPRPELHQTLLLHVFNEPFQDFPAQALARHLAPAEEDGGLHLVAFLEEAQHVVLLGLV